MCTSPVCSIRAVLGLVWVVMLLMPDLSSAVDMQRQSDQEDSNERPALNISFSKLYSIVFSQSYATQFYSCLCSDASSECEIMNEIHPSKLHHFQVKRIIVEEGESQGSVFFCEKPTFHPRNNIVCTRQTMENSECGPSSICNLVHLQFPENGCDRKCVSLGFKGYSVHFAQTDIREGQCDVTEASLSTSITTSEATITSLATALSSTSENTSSLSTPSSILREETVDSHSEKDQPTSEATSLGVGIGGALVLALIATVALAVLCRRRRAKSRHSYESVQPYATGADSVDAETDEAERGAPAAIISHCAHADGDLRTYTTLMVAGSVYCSIGDEGITSAVAEKGTSNCPRSFSDNTIVYQSRPVTNGTTRIDFIGNIRQQELSKAKTVTENGEDGSAGVNVYARLDNGRKEEREELRKSILETYNTGNEWGDFVSTETTEPPEIPEDGKSLSMAEPFCEDLENAYETIDSLDFRGAASETEESRGGADHLSDARSETESEVHSTDMPTVEYYVLEDVANNG